MRPGALRLRHSLSVCTACAVLLGTTACLLAPPATRTTAPPVTVPSATLPPATALPSTPVTSSPNPPPATSTPRPTPLPSATPIPTLVPTPDVVLIRGPYLQSVTANSVTVVWETDLPGRGEVAYGEMGTATSRVSDPEVGQRHAVTLVGLTPYTVYHYRVESGGAPLSEDFAFRTAAAPNQGGFTFVAFGDTRTQHQMHQAVVARILKLAPDFVLHTGDLVEHGSAPHEWETFFEIERELLARAPLFPALGNHDGNDPHFFDLFYLPGNERWYAFDYGSARFICLQVDGIARFDPWSEQYTWLEETLAANTQPWLFIAFHIPPYSSLREDAVEIAVREALTPLFERYGVDIVFNGHHHEYQRSLVHGVTYIVTGGGGAPIYEVTQADDHVLAYENVHHVVHITIDGDTLTGVGVTPDGEEFDRFTLSLP